jgi:hypothetical protein
METNYSDRRREQAEARLAQEAQNNREYARGLNGVDVPSVWGQLGKTQHDSNNPPPAPAAAKALAGGASGGRSSAGRASPARAASPALPAKPWLPEVDGWVANLPKGIFYALGVVGAICGLGYGFSAGGLSLGVVYGLLGGLGGLILVPLLAKVFKLAVAVALVGLTGLLIYLFAFSHGGH